ncbi:kinase-like domain-containing protein [Leucosporidium creatinivorum]|uniref:Kinase-like domain-containing protein n=1 Tax=Leucosporidium creatinivorum TaxID=106004 RepID=A0A1Y2G1U3_9BASI|nr:kinase-like domain-containing protein [Leucosporidium creatinivorum]
MFKLFGGVSSAPDQTTPKASAQPTPNPFDSLPSATTASTSTPQRTNSIASLAALLPSGARTPTVRQHPSVSHQRDSVGGGFFSGPAGPGDVTPGGLGAGPAPVTPGGLPTTAISRVEPDFSFKTQPAALARKKDSGSSPKGKLFVKLIAARHLSAPSAASRPYVVVTFDQNEFVSREPIHEEGEEAVGVARVKGDASPGATAKGPPSPSNGAAKLPEEPMSPTNTSTLSPPPLGSGLGRSLSSSPRNGSVSEGSSTTTNGGSSGTASPAPPPRLAPIEGPAMKVDGEVTPVAEHVQDPLATLSAYNPTWKHEVFFDVMNEKSLLQISIYDRSVEEEMFLGLVEIRPKLVNGHTVDQWFQLVPRWEEEEAVTGEIRVQIRYEKSEGKRGLRVNDFDFLRMIGKGTFGRVFQVRKKDTHRIYAMKVLSKREIVAKKEVAHTIGERKILQKSSDSPFLLGLKFSFQSETDLYLVMDYKCGGELFHHLQKEGRFTEDRARFYTAEIVLAFEHLHKYDIVYRDLKPENILLDATGHIVLCDFGLSKPDLPSDALTNTFCGTTEYLAPEVLLDDHGYSKLVDFWSLGVLLFEMCCGWSPFYAEDTQQMYKLICFGKVKFPRGVIGEDGKQFVKGLLNRNPKHRLGATRDAAELKEHAFFKSIDWDHLAARQIAPPFKPYVDSDESVANFDPEFTEANLFDEAPADVHFDEDDPSPAWLDQASKQAKATTTPMEIRPQKRPPMETLTNSVQENFRGFTFSGEGESMIHHAAGLFANTHIHPSPPTTSAEDKDDEWEDTPMKGA